MRRFNLIMCRGLTTLANMTLVRTIPLEPSSHLDLCVTNTNFAGKAYLKFVWMHAQALSENRDVSQITRYLVSDSHPHYNISSLVLNLKAASTSIQDQMRFT